MIPPFVRKTQKTNISPTTNWWLAYMKLLLFRLNGPFWGDMWPCVFGRWGAGGKWIRPVVLIKLLGVKKFLALIPKDGVEKSHVSFNRILLKRSIGTFSRHFWGGFPDPFTTNLGLESSASLVVVICDECKWSVHQFMNVQNDHNDHQLLFSEATFVRYTHP